MCETGGRIVGPAEKVSPEAERSGDGSVEGNATDVRE
jgi:hypothetical protein